MASLLANSACLVASPRLLPRVICQSNESSQSQERKMGRREVLLRSSEIASLAAIFQFRYSAPLGAIFQLFRNALIASFSLLFEILSGTKPSYLGIQKSTQSLALCPATNNCISTSEDINDNNHYAHPWNYNAELRKKPISKDEAMQELLQVVTSVKPDNFTPRIAERKENYLRVEYESPILGFVDDVEFWFPPGKGSIVEYRSASRFGNFDFDINRKRIKALRVALEKKGWASESKF